MFGCFSVIGIPLRWTPDEALILLLTHLAKLTSVQAFVSRWMRSAFALEVLWLNQVFVYCQLIEKSPTGVSAIARLCLWTTHWIEMLLQNLVLVYIQPHCVLFHKVSFPPLWAYVTQFLYPHSLMWNPRISTIVTTICVESLSAKSHRRPRSSTVDSLLLRSILHIWEQDWFTCDSTKHGCYCS